jgi:predicted dehydrogenase
MKEETLSPIRLAILGCGAITQIHYTPALVELQRARIVEVAALIDPATESLAAVSLHFPNAQCVTRLEDLKVAVDAAVVASPARMHAEHTTALMNLGLHVLCEKPMAATTEQCEIMLKASRQSGCLLAVGLFRRFFPATQQMHDLIATRALGEVVSVEITEGNRFQWRAKTDSFFRKSAGGGGVLLDIGSHVLDLALWWFSDPTNIRYEDDAMGGVEANCRVYCEFANRVRGTVHLSREANLKNRYFVQFERGWAAWNPANPGAIELGIGNEFACDARVHNVATIFNRPWLGTPGRTYYESFMAQIENFASAARGRTKLRVPGEEGIRSIRMIETCYQNSNLMRMQWLSAEEVAAAQKLRC